MLQESPVEKMRVVYQELSQFAAQNPRKLEPVSITSSQVTDRQLQTRAEDRPLILNPKSEIQA
jgi:hypothetical protein